MGTHPSAPSTVVWDGEEISLEDFFRRYPGWRGSDDATLPYLFKVLSVQKALSIQAHPDKQLAERLHAEAPQVYKDDNHKPEMAVAITPFQGMCGFRPLSEIVSHLETVPELGRMVSSEAVHALRATLADDSGTDEAQKRALRRAFSEFMQQDATVVEAETARLVHRLAAGGHEDNAIDRLILRLAEQFPGDVGLFAPYWLNVVTLAPGEAMFLAANVPHAYLAGDCVECMACSDNVVRAGLTPKFKDVRTLCDMLTYNAGSANVVRGQAADDVRTEYSVPVPEFRIARIVLPADHEAAYSLPPPPSAAILLVADGAGSATVTDPPDGSPAELSLTRGQSFLQASGTNVSLRASEPMTVFRVHVAP